ncbi:MAG: hypothetical protein HY679_06530 [Chloroflexi bacterium]|nr:hypothetical protein [Chloroflexota bacterium]
MKLSRLLATALAVAGAASAARVLRRRHAWEQTHNRVAICVDFDDAHEAAIRAALPFDSFLGELARHGATHLSLPELTLNRLIEGGRLTPQSPATPFSRAPRVGRWNYLHGDPALVSQLAAELSARLPYTEPAIMGEGTLVFAGDLAAIGSIGMGFDASVAAIIAGQGLGVVPRPVSYPWPEDSLITLSLAQASVFGKLIAFDGEMILGHEMHLSATLEAMEREGLTLVYFAESRHQKGDWFVAKRRAPAVVLAHGFTPAGMIPLDYHAAAHLWAHLARERGIRFCYVTLFKVLHATAPLEALHYVGHIKEALEAEGFVVTADASLPVPVPAPDKKDLALVGLTSAGAASAALAGALNLPEAAAVPLVALAAGAAVALPYLEQPRDRLEAQYPPSYAPKLLALAAALSPVAALAARNPLEWGQGLLLQTAAAAGLAVFTSGQDYHLRIEEYRGFNLDWLLPLAYAATGIPDAMARVAAISALVGAWAVLAQRGQDPLAKLDPAHAEGHTHHLSAATRLLGDARMVLGPKPARKWAGLGAAGTAAGLVLASRGHRQWAAVAALAGAVGGVLGLVGFRRPERALAVTAKESLPSWGVGIAVGLLALLFYRRE